MCGSCPDGADENPSATAASREVAGAGTKLGTGYVGAGVGIDIGAIDEKAFMSMRCDCGSVGIVFGCVLACVCGLEIGRRSGKLGNAPEGTVGCRSGGMPRPTLANA